MHILAVECSTNIASCAVTDDEELLGVYTESAGKRHSELLLPMVDKLLTGLSLGVSDIDLFSCAAGPGSFTGIRIGCSIIKGLAFDSGKPCVGVSALEALAFGFRGYPVGTYICAAIDARRNNVYCSLFCCDDDGIPKRLCADKLSGAEAIVSEIAASGRKTVVCGDGAGLILRATEKQNIDGLIFAAPHMLAIPGAYQAALCALHSLNGGAASGDRELSPIYLRPTQAERELKSGISD